MLNDILKVLKNLPEESKLYMDDWFNVSGLETLEYDPVACGTACCIVGYSVLDTEFQEKYYLNGGDPYDAVNVLRLVLGSSIGDGYAASIIDAETYNRGKNAPDHLQQHPHVSTDNRSIPVAIDYIEKLQEFLGNE